MPLILGTLAILFIVATVLPLWKHEAWWVRIFDFPRAQVAVGGCLVTAAYLAFLSPRTPVEMGLLAALVVCAAYQTWKMMPYTPLHPRQVRSARAGSQPSGRISVIIANVLMENREAGRFVRMVREHDPDVLLTVETDHWWVDRLSVLDGSYPFSVKVPLPNTYGMVLHSRLEIVDAEVRHLVDASIPSIHARIKLAEGPTVRLHCLHPRPPGPTADENTIERDAEILLVGKEARTAGEPTIVMGDLNDVAWSYTTTLFQRVSGLLDPRVGRGMFNTYHAGNPLARWPLDHLFHSNHFELVRIERLPAWGSDHFPILIRLQYSTKAVELHEVPDVTRADRLEASAKIEQAYDD